jgi:YD repeat-containing protein
MKKKYSIIRVLFVTLFLFCAVPYATAGAVSYTYDDAGRLIRADFGNGKVIDYTYDKAGNLLERQVGSSTGVFSDVPSGYWAENYIIAIYNAGITLGCAQDDPNTPQNERRYCPADPVTRGQMAAFIIRAKYGESFTYTTTPYFSDVPSTHTFFKYVQKLRDDGITTVSGTYSVDSYVTRGQMAAFIIRSKYGEDFTYTTTPYYSDVPSTHNFFKYVQKLRDDGITTTTGTYLVDNNVTRDQMAAFLSRAFLGME